MPVRFSSLNITANSQLVTISISNKLYYVSIRDFNAVYNSLNEVMVFFISRYGPEIETVDIYSDSIAAGIECRNEISKAGYSTILND